MARAAAGGGGAVGSAPSSAALLTSVLRRSPPPPKKKTTGKLICEVDHFTGRDERRVSNLFLCANDCTQIYACYMCACTSTHTHTTESNDGAFADVREQKVNPTGQIRTETNNCGCTRPTTLPAWPVSSLPACAYCSSLYIACNCLVSSQFPVCASTIVAENKTFTIESLIQQAK